MAEAGPDYQKIKTRFLIQHERIDDIYQMIVSNAETGELYFQLKVSREEALLIATTMLDTIE